MECVARNPCKQCKRNQNPDGVTEFCRAFGTYFLVADFSRGFASLHHLPVFLPGLRPSSCWVFVVVRADDLPQPLRRRVAKGSAPTCGESDKAECGKIQINLVFRSLLCTFGCRRRYSRSEMKKKNAFSFCISLAYSYLCGMFVRYIYKNSKTKDK